MLLWPYGPILIFYRVPVVVMLLWPSRTIITGCDTFTTLFDTPSRLIDDDNANATNTTTTIAVANDDTTTTPVVLLLRILQYMYIHCRCLRPGGLYYFAFATSFCHPSNTNINFERSDYYLDIDDSTEDNNVHDTSIVMLLWLRVAIPTIHSIQQLHVQMMIQHITVDNNNWYILSSIF